MPKNASKSTKKSSVSPVSKTKGSATKEKLKLKAPEPAMDTELDQDSDDMEFSEAGYAAQAIKEEPSFTASNAPKNFRTHPDIEDFFRFIYENDLRLEALQIINEILVSKQEKKKKLKAAH